MLLQRLRNRLRYGDKYYRIGYNDFEVTSMSLLYQTDVIDVYKRQELLQKRNQLLAELKKLPEQEYNVLVKIILEDKKYKEGVSFIIWYICFVPLIHRRMSARPSM